MIWGCVASPLTGATSQQRREEAHARCWCRSTYGHYSRSFLVFGSASDGTIFVKCARDKRGCRSLQRQHSGFSWPIPPVRCMVDIPRAVVFYRRKLWLGFSRYVDIFKALHISRFSSGRVGGHPVRSGKVCQIMPFERVGLSNSPTDEGYSVVRIVPHHPCCSIFMCFHFGDFRGRMQRSGGMWSPCLKLCVPCRFVPLWVVAGNVGVRCLAFWWAPQALGRSEIFLKGMAKWYVETGREERKALRGFTQLYPPLLPPEPNVYIFRMAGPSLLYAIRA